MGMSTDMAPRYLSMNSTGQMTYVLDASNINLTQVQLAVPSDIVLIQDGNKQHSINLCESPVLVADVGAENVGWIGSNIIVLVSQPQEILMLEQEAGNSNIAHTWQVEDVTTTVESQKENPQTENEDLSEASSATTVEDAKCWFRDSLITAAALSTLTTYVQSNNSSKVE